MSTRNSYFCKSAGFTLAELMAVVVIVGIMASIGFGSYKKSIERSRFAEGISMAHHIMEARERYYYDNLEKADSDRITNDLGKLDLELTNGSGSGATFTGKNFIVTISADYVEAARRNGEYKIRVYQDTRAFGANAKKSDQCIGVTGDGADYCVSMGYGNCSGGTCSKY